MYMYNLSATLFIMSASSLPDLVPGVTVIWYPLVFGTLPRYQITGQSPLVSTRLGRFGLSQGFWSGGDFGPGGLKSPGSGQIKRSGPGILVRALKSLSSFVYQRPCMFQLAACTPGLPDEVK